MAHCAKAHTAADASSIPGTHMDVERTDPTEFFSDRDTGTVAFKCASLCHMHKIK